MQVGAWSDETVCGGRGFATYTRQGLFPLAI